MLASAVGLDEADDHVGAALVAAAALVEHGEGLAHAGRGPEVEAQAAPGHRRPYPTSRSRARLRSSTFTVFSPRKPHARPSVWECDERHDRVRRRGPGRRRPGRPGRGRWPRRCPGRGPSPTTSPRRPAPARSAAKAVERAVGGDPVRHLLEQRRVGRAEVGRARRGRVVAGARRRTAGAGSRWAGGCPWRR